LQSISERLSLDSIVAALQILAEARSRMRGVSHGRLVAELALVRVARLEDLTDLNDLVQRLSSLETGASLSHSSSAASTQKKLTITDAKPGLEVTATKLVEPVAEEPTGRGSRSRRQISSPPAAVETKSLKEEAGASVEATEPSESAAGGLVTEPVSSESAQHQGGDASERRDQAGATPIPPTQEGDSRPLELSVVRQRWEELVKKVGANLGWRLGQAEAIAVEAPDVLVIAAKPGYNSIADPCGSDEAREKIAHCLQRILHRPMTVRYERSTEPAHSGPLTTSADARRPEALASDPMVQKVVELFEARPMHLEFDDTDGS
jgi:DNA polymerase-3 subunit gamma/tau